MDFCENHSLRPIDFEESPTQQNDFAKITVSVIAIHYKQIIMMIPSLNQNYDSFPILR